MGIPYWHLTVKESLGVLKTSSKERLTLETLEKFQSSGGILTFPDVLADFNVGNIFRALGASKLSLKWVSTFSEQFCSSHSNHLEHFAASQPS